MLNGDYWLTEARNWLPLFKQNNNKKQLITVGVISIETARRIRPGGEGGGEGRGGRSEGMGSGVGVSVTPYLRADRARETPEESNVPF